MKAITKFFNTIFGVNPKQKKRRVSKPSETPKATYNLFVEHELIDKNMFTCNWDTDKVVWRRYYKNNRDFVLNKINHCYSIGFSYSKEKLLGGELELPQYSETTSDRVVEFISKKDIDDGLVRISRSPEDMNYKNYLNEKKN